MSELPSGLVKVPEGVVHRSFGEQTVLLNLETGQYHGLNPTGGRMLALLEETGSAEAVADRVTSEYGVPREDVERDLVELCSGLAERGLLVVEDA